MRLISYSTIILLFGFLLYSNSSEQTKLNKEGESVSLNGITYFYSVNEEETDKAKNIYYELLKINKPKYKLNKIPFVIAEFKRNRSKNTPLFLTTKQQENDGEFKIVFFKKNIEAFFINKILPILKNRVDFPMNTNKNGLSEVFYLKFLISHLAKLTGPSIVQNSEKEFLTLDKILFDKLLIIENIRSEMAAISITNSLLKKNLILGKQVLIMFYEEIAHLIYLSENGSEVQKKYSKKIIEFYNKKGCINHNIITNKTGLDIDNMKIVSNKLLSKMTKFETKSDKEENIAAIVKFLEDSDENDNIKVEKTIKIIQPNGGEVWELGDKKEIIWEAKGLSNNIKITIWKKDKLIDIIKKNIQPSTGKYIWEVGKCKNIKLKKGKGYFIKIREQGGNDFQTQDESNKPFSIIKNKRE